VTVLTAFLDANVLFPAATRSVLLELARKKTSSVSFNDCKIWSRGSAACDAAGVFRSRSAHSRFVPF
jgi:hypothetical protein